MSWAPVPAGSGFGPENLPYGVVMPRGGSSPRCAVRIGDSALDLAALQAAGRLPAAPSFATPVLNEFLAAPRAVWLEVREELQALLAADPAPAELAALLPLAECDLAMPIAIGDYVDFYSSLEHATNLGRLFRPGSDPLLPNWRHLPVAYHGRSGTVVVSGTPVRRPRGQLPPEHDGGVPSFGPTARLDIELELGFVAGGPPKPLGEPIAVEDAADHIFGVVLVNDWSARDIQRWEYQPLGPFLGKSFATSISPWIVPIAALEPHRVKGPPQDPPPLPYVAAREPWNFDIALEIELNGAVVSQTNARDLYWSAAQQLAHASSGGAPIRPGDLHATGTISGPEPDQCGSLLEMSGGRGFLDDGDSVVLRGHAGGAGGPLVSLGEVAGRVEPAPSISPS
jgi:fumarylacetoacetase